MSFAMSASLHLFHPAVAAWFAHSFAAPTAAQAAAWPAIARGEDVLVAAPTGSGKTLTAFLWAINSLVEQSLVGFSSKQDHLESLSPQSSLWPEPAPPSSPAPGTLPDRVQVLYISPLKALSNDIRLNLEGPLAGIGEELAALGLPDPGIRAAVRTGDTPQNERAALRRLAPHILVTTPESLYVLLGSDSGRAMLSGVRSVIVDEIHALANSKRGSHLTLSLERLQALNPARIQRIGLSATQKPIEKVAAFLCGGRLDAKSLAPSPSHAEERAGVTGAFPPEAPKSPCNSKASPLTSGEGEQTFPCTIINAGHVRERDLALELPRNPLEAVMSGEAWETLYDRLAELADAHRTTLVFVNTRRLSERVTRHLAERLGRDAVAAHHGSLAKELRLDAEQRLKHGRLRMLVATASLELGIDIGDVDLVCQLGSPGAIATFLQRVGRAGHAVEATPKGRLFPLSRDDLAESVALLDCVRRGELDALIVPPQPLDVLAQQIVAEVACREWDETALFGLMRRAAPYRDLSREQFNDVVRMLAEGFSTRRGTRAAWLHRDVVAGALRARRGARLTALSSGGTIPDTADYLVVLEPQGQIIGSVHEDFAVESLIGDVFQLGNTSYRILKVEADRLRVEDAQGAPPSIPFWIGEAPGRSDELSAGVSRLRETLSQLFHERTPGESVDARLARAINWLCGELRIDARAARELAEYLLHAQIALGFLPTQKELGIERFFDESGAMQLIIHSPLGSRINKAWGLALRKRFCRSFNFELQAAATEDNIVLSLSTSHSFPLDDVGRFLHSASAREVLVQALLDAPLFGVRWRWNATTALALPRMSGGKKIAPQIQRMRSEDLLGTVFPDQVACLENIVGERQIPDHPLVAQTLHDCLHEAMDVDGFLALLQRLEAGEVRIHARDLTAPSPLAAEVLSARPYAFLDDAPLEERRTRAVQQRRYIDPQQADDLGRLDAAAIAKVREEAWPDVRNPDEMHDALNMLGFVRQHEADNHAGWNTHLAALARARRAARITLPEGETLWVMAERLPQFRALHPSLQTEPDIEVPADYVHDWDADIALRELLRARLSGSGPASAAELGAPLGRSARAVEPALLALETEGFVFRGRFTPDAPHEEWCERGLLARIHRYTLGRLRREIEPVPARDFIRFLLHWQHLAPSSRMRGPDALGKVLGQLEGYEAPAAAWEASLLPARVADYQIQWLDEQCRAGRIVWQRLHRGTRSSEDGARARSVAPLPAMPLVLLPRRHRADWNRLAAAQQPADVALSSRAQLLLDWLQNHGAAFFDEMQDDVRLLRSELEDALGELVARGALTSDSFSGLRTLLMPAARREKQRKRRRPFGLEDAGRWSPVAAASAPVKTAMPRASDPQHDAADIERLVRVLLRRYGVLSWRLLEREAAWLPPWRVLLRELRRLEARGEIRGGRFVQGLSGEQFALPEAIPLLRRMRDEIADGELVCVSGADPLNLSGIAINGPKVPRLASARLLYRDGVPLATRIGGNIEWLGDGAAPGGALDAETRRRGTCLLRGEPDLQALAANSEGLAGGTMP
ncbi:DEAD/DEAH box helicase [Denitratimonas sp. CY0512]|uniref:DEAD/DEAH box helicase n=1 Tax=Denitratimonas sp. CY0512 TaxID=3131940 RepID=UPI0030B6018B